MSAPTIEYVPVEESGITDPDMGIMNALLRRLMEHEAEIKAFQLVLTRMARHR